MPIKLYFFASFSPVSNCCPFTAGTSQVSTKLPCWLMDFTHALPHQDKIMISFLWPVHIPTYQELWFPCLFTLALINGIHYEQLCRTLLYLISFCKQLKTYLSTTTCTFWGKCINFVWHTSIGLRIITLKTRIISSNHKVVIHNSMETSHTITILPKLSG